MTEGNTRNLEDGRLSSCKSVGRRAMHPQPAASQCVDSAGGGCPRPQSPVAQLGLLANMVIFVYGLNLLIF